MPELQVKRLRWFMFWFCVGWFAGEMGWAIDLLITDPWMGIRMLPVFALTSLLPVAMGSLWLALAKGWIRIA